MSRYRAIYTFALMAVLATACTGGSSATESVFAELASELSSPLSDEYFVTLVDLDAAFAEFGLDAPVGCDDESQQEQILENVEALADLAGSLPFAYLMGAVNPDLQRTNFGFSMCEIHAAAQNHDGEVGNFEVLLGVFDQATVERAATSWASPDAVTAVNGATLYSADQGDAQQLLVTNNLAVWSVSSSGASMEAYLDSSRVRLVDDPHVSDVLSSLAERGAVAVNIVGPASTTTVSGGDDLLAHWELLGLGLTAGDEGQAVVLVSLAHMSERAAEENLIRLQTLITAETPLRRWSGQVAIESIEVDGTMLNAVVIGLDGNDPLWVLQESVLLTPDGLFAH